MSSIHHARTHRVVLRGRLATALQATLFASVALLAGAWGWIMRSTGLQIVLPFFVIDRWLGDVPLLGGPLTALLGPEACLIDLLAGGLATGALIIYALALRWSWRLLLQPKLGVFRTRAARLGAVAVPAVVLGLGDLELGAIEATYADLLMQAETEQQLDAMLELPLSSIPTAEQLDGEGWALIDADGRELALDHGSLATAARCGGWLFLLAYGLVPAALLAGGVAMARRRWRELPHQR